MLGTAWTKYSLGGPIDTPATGGQRCGWTDPLVLKTARRISASTIRDFEEQDFLLTGPGGWRGAEEADLNLPLLRVEWGA